MGQRRDLYTHHYNQGGIRFCFVYSEYFCFISKTSIDSLLYILTHSFSENFVRDLCELMVLFWVFMQYPFWQVMSKSVSHLSITLVLFASMKALTRWWKMIFIWSYKLFSSLRYLIFWPDFFGHVWKLLDKMAKIDFKIYIITTNCNANIAQYFKK